MLEMMNDPKIAFTTPPQNMIRRSNSWRKIGSIKVKPESWKDLFFPNIHGDDGSRADAAAA